MVYSAAVTFAVALTATLVVDVLFVVEGGVGVDDWTEAMTTRRERIASFIAVGDMIVGELA
jgi:hypothetical protein